jgi:SagB-type dehydrogenase family enzyme
MELPEINSLLRMTELTRANLPALTERIEDYLQQPPATEPRHYEGYRHWPLPRFRPRWWPGLDRVLRSRRWRQDLSERPLRMGELGRLLQLAHGVCASGGRGPTPSAGGLNALELYLVHWGHPRQAPVLEGERCQAPSSAAVMPELKHNTPVPTGVFHYDRAGHRLAELTTVAERPHWLDLVPSWGQLAGGRVIWIVVGDVDRVRAKYGVRAERFLLLEAGHLMQNLCLVSTSLGLVTIPLGGFLEGEIAAELQLLGGDRVLSCGVCGACP